MSGGKCVYINSRGIVNNYEEIKIMSEKLKPLIIVASETHLTDQVENSEVNIKSYNLIRCDSNSVKTGGTAMYIKRNVNYGVYHSENFKNNGWLLAVKIIKRGFKCNIIAIYHSPSKSDAEFIAFFKDWCEKNLNESEINIIVGDFNLDLMSRSFYSEKIKTVIDALGLKQLVKSPTRIVERSKTLIDFVISNQYNLRVNVLSDEKVSDHSTITFDIDKSIVKSLKHKKVNKIVGYSAEKFRENLAKVNWLVSTNMDVNDKAEYFVTNIKKCLNEFIKSVKNKKESKVWYNDQLYNMRNEKNLAYQKAVATDMVSDWIYYENIAKEYMVLVKSTKSRYYENQLMKANGNQKETWKILKGLVNGVKDETKSEINFDGIIANDNKVIANKFNNYYVESISDLIDTIPIQEELTFVIYKDIATTFEFECVPEDVVLRSIMRIKSKGDIEFINKSILLDAMPVIATVFTDVINSSLMEVECPASWKNSILSPIPKIPGTSNGHEFRPVNQLPTYEKVLEGVVKEQIQKHITENEIIIDDQYGFREGYDCESALDFTIMQWKLNVDQGKIVIAVFLDLKRAFETVDRDRLIKKLEKYGIKGMANQWFKSYLSNRTQITKYGDALSEKLETEHGVPQGSRLSSDLFLLYINDIVSCFTYAKLALFADDNTIYITCTDLNDGIRMLNEDLARVNDWLNLNKMKLNVNKSNYIIFNNNQSDEMEETVKINGMDISKVDEVKTLGMKVNKNFKMDAHVNYIIKKVAKKIGFMSRIGRNLTLQSRSTVYKSIISPHFEYCPSLLFTCNKNEIDLLQKQQNKAMRIVLRCPKDTSVKSMLNELQLLSVRQRIFYLTMTRIFKLKNGLLPKQLCEMVSFVGEVQKYWLRNEHDFRIIQVKKASTQKSMMISGLRFFNNLPSDIKRETNAIKFKTNLINHVKNNVEI